ncbi:hypothetical protein B0A49_06872 [Cryomyces minteri]|uniref:Ketoreductase (KR) domain-containing protein n=1 Tax=Cryomyces minteri TaxID=331657 RepID=A0A4U0WEW0_9PEZI|nr:hypothetical protein B0A49_08320 [Cryomyces minteri]TKA61708.1 hypothetical protein B0A49_08528 [Cryomyces minteri]TKA64194.1 hypothetical protein B0A49_06872 [Cryomyces minteri]
MTFGSPPDRTLAVIGCGPGIGVHVAATFATHGFNRIILLSRDIKRLEDDKATILEAAGDSKVQVALVKVDLADEASLEQALKQLEELGPVECIFFNAARVGPSKLLDFPAAKISKDFATTNTALYSVAQWGVPRLLELSRSDPSSKPSLLVTNGLLHTYPMPDLFSLCMVKSAQRSLVECLAKTYNPQGVHVGLVTVGGQVMEDAKQLNPANIAQKTWELFDQARGAWKWETQILEQ